LRGEYLFFRSDKSFTLSSSQFRLLRLQISSVVGIDDIFE